MRMEQNACRWFYPLGNNTLEEKATSNICSNQSFIATIIGACLLSEGDDGLQQKLDQSKENYLYFKEGLQKINNISFAFTGPTLNECVLELKTDIKKMINMASSNGIHLGVDITNRANQKKYDSPIF